MKKPTELIKRVPLYKKLMSIDYRKQYDKNYNLEDAISLENELWKKRKNKIKKKDEKIKNAMAKIQQVTLSFINQLIGLYDKSSSQKDKMYIILELQKYYNPQIIRFFFKLNDTELNKQLRQVAFKYLQKFSYKPKARKQKYMRIYTKSRKQKMYLKKFIHMKHTIYL